MNPYIKSELTNVQQYLNFTFEEDLMTMDTFLDMLSIPVPESETYSSENSSNLPPSFYTGALTPQRQPLALFEGNIYSRYNSFLETQYFST
jgi:hypothetical protein